MKKRVSKKRRVKIKDSKAMSNVIATLLIILLAIVLVIIMWIIIKDLVAKDTEIAEIKTEFFGENIRITALKFDEDIVKISLQKIGRRDNPKTTLWSSGEISGSLGVDIISVVDLSGSMISCNSISEQCCNDVLGATSYSSRNCYGLSENHKEDCVNICNGVWVNRLTPTKDSNREILTIINEIEDSRVGIVAYNAGIISSSGTGLTSNTDILNSVIDSWEVGGNTCICCGINEALRILEEQSPENKLKKIIVMSDGQANTRCQEQGTGDPSQDAIRSSCGAYSTLSNLTIYSVGAGDNVNENTLREIANCGKGVYFPALDISGLIEAYRNVIGEIKTNYITSYSRLDYIYIVFKNETSSHIEKIANIPRNLVIRTYSFDLTDKLEGKVVRIEIYPVILLKSGKEEIGPLFDFWDA